LDSNKKGLAEMQALDFIGSWGGIRTPDQVVNSHPLCLLSYPGTITFFIIYKGESSGQQAIWYY
jgi:hypothetical protein